MNKTYAPGDNVLKCIYQKMVTIKLQSVTALEKVENKPLNIENLNPIYFEASSTSVGRH